MSKKQCTTRHTSSLQAGKGVNFVVVVVAGLLIVGVIAYYVVRNSNLFSSNRSGSPLNDIKWKESGVKDLPEARVQLQVETDKLVSLTKRAEFERNAIEELAKQYGALETNVVLKTAAVVSGPLAQASLATDIALKKQKVDTALQNWKATQEAIAALKTAPTSPLTLPKLLEDARANAELVKNYIEELKNAVNNLTPQNSGLTQTQIDAYAASAAAAAAAAEAASNTINSIPATPTNQSTGSTNTNQNQQNSSPNNSNQSNSGGSNSGESNSGETLVTDDEIEDQQEAVNNAQQDVDDAEEAENNNENENNEDPSNADTGDNPSWSQGGEGEPDPPQGDIELIEGANRR